MARVDDEASLLKRVAAEDQSACRTLVDGYLPVAWRYALAFTGRADLADDLAQDAMIKLVRVAPRWKPKAKISTWLYQVVRNQVIDEARRTQKTSGLQAADEIIDDRADIDGQAASYAAAITIEQAVLQLNQRQRIAVTLFYFDDLSIKQAASLMNLSVDAFQSLIARARRELKIILDGQGPDLLEDLK